MWLIVMVAGCNQGPGVREPEPYLPSTEVQPLEPELDSDAVASAVVDLLRNVVEHVPTGLPGAIEALMAHADGACPEIQGFSDETTERIVWYDDCTTAGGATFRGGLELTIVTDEIGNYGERTSGFQLYVADLDITTPDGRSLSGGGYWGLSHTDGDGYSAANSYASGQLLADPVTAGADSWLLGHTSGTVGIYASMGERWRNMYIGGSWPLHEGPFVGVSVQDIEITPGSCDTEPLGAIAVREPNGVWHDIAFATYDAVNDELVDCDGCGTHLAAGVPLGDTICMSPSDIASIVDFDGGLPW